MSWVRLLNSTVTTLHTLMYIHTRTHARTQPHRHSCVYVRHSDLTDMMVIINFFCLHSISFASASSFISNTVFCFVLSFVFLLLLLYVFKFQFIRATWCSFHMVHYTEWPHSVKHINMRSSSYFLPFCCFNFIVLLCAWVLLSCFQATFFVFIIFFLCAHLNCLSDFSVFKNEYSYTVTVTLLRKAIKWAPCRAT